MASGWNIPPTAFANVARERLERVYKATAITVFNGVVQESPVDMGWYRNNHHVSIGGKDIRYEHVEGQVSNSFAFGDGVQVINSIPSGQFPVIYIQNNLPYAQALEDGRSDQAPTGVYGIVYNNVKVQLGLSR